MIFYKYNGSGANWQGKRQKANQLIDVAEWGRSEEIEPYQEGARAKNKVYCPAPAPYSFLIEGHDYLFKQSHKRYPAQFWAEVIAYRLGCLMNVPVPPAFVAIDSRRALPGAVIEWFYNYPNEPREVYTSGGDPIQKLIPDYDRKKGEQHNVQDIISIIERLEREGGLAEDWQKIWGRIFCFDTMIGNTDRHQDNWGIVEHGNSIYFSPAFDNGTALGHEIVEQKLASLLAAPERYARSPKATHHLKWARSDSKKLPHFDLPQRFLKQYSDIPEDMRLCVSFPMDAFKEQMMELVALSNTLPYEYGKLTPQRAEFIIRLTECRRRILLEILE